MLKINLIEKIQFTFNFGGNKKIQSVTNEDINNVNLNSKIYRKISKGIKSRITK